ncbi:hypothetical protein D3C87_1798900 [compost metagenome]
MLSSRKTMRLEENHQTALWIFLSEGLKYCAHFRWMMTVIIIDTNAFFLAFEMETTIHTFKALQTCSTSREWNARSHTSANRSYSVQSIVTTRNF